MALYSSFAKSRGGGCACPTHDKEERGYGESDGGRDDVGYGEVMTGCYGDKNPLAWNAARSSSFSEDVIALLMS